jgi:hypothetical protein
MNFMLGIALKEIFPLFSDPKNVGKDLKNMLEVPNPKTIKIKTIF